jgi:(2Fe-2S) ferredoxin
MAKPTRHIFVCNNDRPPEDKRGCCKARGGVEVVDALKGGLFKRGLKGQLKATRTGCLGGCETGVTVVVYPDNVWYSKVTVGDVDEIIENHLIGGKVVERLLRNADGS